MCHKYVLQFKFPLEMFIMIKKITNEQNNIEMARYYTTLAKNHKGLVSQDLDFGYFCRSIIIIKAAYKWHTLFAVKRMIMFDWFDPIFNF